MDPDRDSPAPSSSPIAAAGAGRHRRRDLIALGVGTVIVLLGGGLLLWRAERHVNRVALAAAPRPVTVVAAAAEDYRGTRSYVGRLDPWVEASVGPQYISAYVDSVRVRPGAAVKAGEVLATLDCANPTSQTLALEMQARKIDANRRAIEDEAARTKGLLDGGFVSPNDVEVKSAQSDAERAHLQETRARFASSALTIKDCVLRSPFDGEIATRTIDPGAFIKPGAAIVSVVDRSTVRVVADAPEVDFDVVAASTVAHILAVSNGRAFDAPISRRAPKADPTTRTVHFEIDVADPKRELPVGTTAMVEISVGKPTPAAVVPLYAATVREGKASLFVVENGKAHKLQAKVIGERGGSLFVDPGAVRPGAQVVTEGAALLEEGDAVRARVGTAPSSSGSEAPSRGGGSGRPR